MRQDRRRRRRQATSDRRHATDLTAPELKPDKLPKIPFHVFDRYEMHIQAFANVVYGNFIILNPHLHNNFK